MKKPKINPLQIAFFGLEIPKHAPEKDVPILSNTISNDVICKIFKIVYPENEKNFSKEKDCPF